MKFKYDTAFGSYELGIFDEDDVELNVTAYEDDGGIVLRAGDGVLFGMDNKRARRWAKSLLKTLEKCK